MRLPNFRYVVFSGVSLGVVIPLIVLSLCLLSPRAVAGLWVFFVWPTSIILTAAESVYFDARFIAILAVSIVGNILWYLLLFTLVWSLGWVLRAWRGSLRDGTTI